MLYLLMRVNDRTHVFHPKHWDIPKSSMKNKTVKSLLASAKKILVPEMNLGQLALEIERSAACEQPVIRLGKANGELFHPDEVFAAIKEAL